MADWAGRTWDLEIVRGPFNMGATLWDTARIWPAHALYLRAIAVPVDPTHTKVWFGQDMDVISTSTGDYTIAGLTVVGVVASTDYLTIEHSEVTVPGTYTVVIAANKVRSAGGVWNLSSFSLPFVAAYTPYDLELKFEVQRRGPDVLRVWFPVPISDDGGVLTDTDRYNIITGPTSIFVDSVSFTPGNRYVDLNVTGEWGNGDYYLEIDADTAFAAHDPSISNGNDTVIWPVDSQEPLFFTAQRRSNTSVRVDFNLPLGAHVNTENPANYTITGPSTITVDDVDFTPGDSFVMLEVSGDWENGTYEVEVNGGTVEWASDDEHLNTTSSSDFIIDSPDCPECPEPEECDCDDTPGPDTGPWLRINGIETSGIVAIDASPSGPRRDVGAENEASDGSLSVTRQVRKYDQTFGTVPLAGSHAVAWAGLFTGEGHVWSYDVSLYSSKGFAPTPGSTFGGYSLVSSGPTPKFGAKCLKLQDSGSGAAVAYSLGYEAYTLSVWRNESAPLELGGPTWHHYVIRSDGAKWFDGVRDDTKVTSGWLSITGGVFQLFELSGGTHGFDDLVIAPFLWLTSWPAQVFAATLPFGLAPYLTATGALVKEASSRRMLGAKCDETVLIGNLDGGERHRDLRRLAVELKGA